MVVSHKIFLASLFCAPLPAAPGGSCPPLPPLCYATAQYGQNGTAHAAGASMLSPVRGSSPTCVACVCGMRAVCGGPGGLTLGSAFPLCCHSNATRAPIANLPNSAQLGGSPYHSPKLHPGPCNTVGMRPWTDRQIDRHTHTHRHTDARDHNTFLVVYDSREM